MPSYSILPTLTSTHHGKVTQSWLVVTIQSFNSQIKFSISLFEKNKLWKFQCIRNRITLLMKFVKFFKYLKQGTKILFDMIIRYIFLTFYHDFVIIFFKLTSWTCLSHVMANLSGKMLWPQNPPGGATLSGSPQRLKRSFPSNS